MTATAASNRTLATSAPGTQVLLGDHLVELPKLAPGDRVVALGELGELIVISKAAADAAAGAVTRASEALSALASASDAQINDFFEAFARRLEDEQAFAPIAAANAQDVADARARGRAVGRLELSERMRNDMIAGLRGWTKMPTRIGEVLERRQGPGFVLERRRAPLGVIAFVFEGRPNVFADAAGVVKNKNTAVFRHRR